MQFATNSPNQSPVPDWTFKGQTTDHRLPTPSLVGLECYYSHDSPGNVKSKGILVISFTGLYQLFSWEQC